MMRKKKAVFGWITVGFYGVAPSRLAAPVL
jgi:hypothetical protein